MTRSRPLLALRIILAVLAVALVIAGFLMDDAAQRFAWLTAALLVLANVAIGIRARLKRAFRRQAREETRDRTRNPFGPGRD